ncbi:hypothetical protein OKW30_000219 [Paraburkholderia sp. Clong3]
MPKHCTSLVNSLASALVVSIALGISGCTGLNREKSTSSSPPLPLAVGNPISEWRTSLKKIQDEIANNKDSPLLYSFDNNHLIPVVKYIFIRSAKYDYNSNSDSNPYFNLFPIAKVEVLNQPATLLIIPKFSNLEIFPVLLGDRNSAADGSNRCENNPSAKTVADGTPQTAEIFTPSEAYSRLKDPEFMINANYFDVRPQLNGQTWKTTKCSVPLGIYYDNYSSGPTGGTHNSGAGDEKYFAGPRHYINEDGKNVAPVDTMIFYESAPSSDYVRVINNDLNSSQSLGVIRTLTSRTVGISGSSLFGRSESGTAPDAGNKQTTRVALGYDSSLDRLYIFEGGNYSNGVSREQVAGLFRSLHVPVALELDGGGSASLAVSRFYAKSVGGTLPTSSCQSLTGVWCSPVTASDGPRPVPSWIGFLPTASSSR